MYNEKTENIKEWFKIITLIVVVIISIYIIIFGDLFNKPNMDVIILNKNGDVLKKFNVQDVDSYYSNKNEITIVEDGNTTTYYNATFIEKSYKEDK